MSLPIYSRAITALSRAEHDYGERLMTLATERATMAGASHVHECDVEWAAKQVLWPVDATEGAQATAYRCVCADRLGVAQPGGERCFDMK